MFRILRYLKGTPGKGLFFKRSPSQRIEVYTDADYGGSQTDRRSTSGYCTFVYGNLVTWRSKKQSVVSRSSAEAEYRSLAQGICEGIWLRRLLSSLKIPYDSQVLLHCDNEAAISIVKNHVHHDRTKHIEIDKHFISEKIDNEDIKLHHNPSRLQIADIMTKALPSPLFSDLCCKLNLFNVYSLA